MYRVRLDLQLGNIFAVFLVNILPVLPLALPGAVHHDLTLGALFDTVSVHRLIPLEVCTVVAAPLITFPWQHSRHSGKSNA